MSRNSISERWALLLVLSAVLSCLLAAGSVAAERQTADELVARAKRLKFPFGKQPDSEAVKQHYETEIALLKSAISRNARHYDAHIALADTYLGSVIGTGHYRGKLTREKLDYRDRMIAALRVLDRAIQIDPTRPAAIEKRAGVAHLYAEYSFLSFRDKLTWANRFAISRISRKQPEIIRLHAEAALDLAWARCLALRALPDVKRLLALTSTNADVLSNYATILMILRDEPDALEVRRQAIAAARAAKTTTMRRRTIAEIEEQWRRNERAIWYRTFVEWSKGPVPRMCMSGWQWPPWVKISRDGRPASYGYPKSLKMDR